jgi:hypothetical protein
MCFLDLLSVLACMVPSQPHGQDTMVVRGRKYDLFLSLVILPECAVLCSEVPYNRVQKSTVKLLQGFQHVSAVLNCTALLSCLYYAVLYCNVMCCAVLCCSVLYITVLFCTVLLSCLSHAVLPVLSVLCCAVLSVLCCAVLSVLCCAVLSCLSYAVVCFALLYFAVLYSVLSVLWCAVLSCLSYAVLCCPVCPMLCCAVLSCLSYAVLHSTEL